MITTGRQAAATCTGCGKNGRTEDGRPTGRNDGSLGEGCMGLQPAGGSPSCSTDVLRSRSARRSVSWQLPRRHRHGGLLGRAVLSRARWWVWRPNKRCATRSVRTTRGGGRVPGYYFLPLVWSCSVPHTATAGKKPPNPPLLPLLHGPPDAGNPRAPDPWIRSSRSPSATSAEVILSPPNLHLMIGFVTGHRNQEGVAPLLVNKFI
jgi:hypothetical protein